MRLSAHWGVAAAPVSRDEEFLFAEDSRQTGLLIVAKAFDGCELTQLEATADPNRITTEQAVYRIAADPVCIYGDVEAKIPPKRTNCFVPIVDCQPLRPSAFLLKQTVLVQLLVKGNSAHSEFGSGPHAIIPVLAQSLADSPNFLTCSVGAHRLPLGDCLNRILMKGGFGRRRLTA